MLQMRLQIFTDSNLFEMIGILQQIAACRHEIQIIGARCPPLTMLATPGLCDRVIIEQVIICDGWKRSDFRFWNARNRSH